MFSEDNPDLVTGKQEPRRPLSPEAATLQAAKLTEQLLEVLEDVPFAQRNVFGRAINDAIVRITEKENIVHHCTCGTGCKDCKH